jgi:Na+/H+-dicarboxylate symporter
MGNEHFDVGKLIRGFNPLSGEALGKLIYNAIITLIIIAVCVGVWYKLFGQRTQKTVQTAQQITNIEKKDNGFRILGIELLGWRS